MLLYLLGNCFDSARNMNPDLVEDQRWNELQAQTTNIRESNSGSEATGATSSRSGLRSFFILSVQGRSTVSLPWRCNYGEICTYRGKYFLYLSLYFSVFVPLFPAFSRHVHVSDPRPAPGSRVRRVQKPLRRISSRSKMCCQPSTLG